MQRLSNKDAIIEALKLSSRRILSEAGTPVRKFRLRTTSIQLFEPIPIRNFRGDGKKGAEILKGHFNFAGQHLDVGRQGDPWPIPAPSERFAFWLHSFDWLWDLSACGDKETTVKARYFVDQWMQIYGKWNDYSWAPDVLSNRLFAWLCNWGAVLSTDRLEPAGQRRRDSVFRQLKHLKSNYKSTPAGIPRLKAAIVISMAGLFRPEKSYEYLNRGLDWLDDELIKQILPDGGHISRNPWNCVLALEILTALDQALEKRGVKASPTFERALERLRHAIPFFRLSDGGLCAFNGSGKQNPAFIENLLKFSKTTASPFSYCPHTGYHRIHKNDTVILIDTGETAPYPYDKDAHLAPLAFEMSTKSGRLIVNCGWGAEQPEPWKNSVRLTAAHSTLSLDHKSAGQIATEGLKQKVYENHVSHDVGVVDATRREQSEGVWLEMSHSGYEDMTGLTHRRRLYVHETGNDVRGEDSLLVPLGKVPKSRNAIPFDIRFHLHPSIKATLAQDLHSALLIQPGQIGWRFRTDGGPLRIEESVYLGEGDKPVRSEQIVISGSALADGDGESKSNRVRWSIRRLEGK